MEFVTIDVGKIWQVILILAGNGTLAPVQEAAVIEKAKNHTEKFNFHVMNMAKHNAQVESLASPVTGGGVKLSRFQLLFLLANQQNKKQPAEWANFVWQILAAQNQKLLKEGKMLETVEENLAELTQQASTFAQEQLPVLKGLGIF